MKENSADRLPAKSYLSGIFFFDEATIQIKLKIVYLLFHENVRRVLHLFPHFFFFHIYLPKTTAKKEKNK
jgi:hypothetical protein